MLPKDGFDFEQYQAVLFDIDEIWDEYLAKGRDWDPAITHLLTMSVVRGELRTLGVADDDHRMTIRRAIALLDKALGAQIFTEMLCWSNVETVVGALRFARFHRDFPPPECIGKGDLQMTILTHVIDRVVNHAGGRNRYQFLIKILDTIHMPYSKHQIVHTHVTDKIKNLTVTHH